MQRVGGLKEKFLFFENLYTAYKKAYLVTKSYSSYKFAFHVEKELFLLQKELSENTYVPGDYFYFTIQDPKERVISVAQFRDRVVHHALVNILEPIYEKRFIFDSYATRKEKGTHKAILCAQGFLCKNHWYLKMDIRKYFDSINHKVLNTVIERKIKDRYILDLCRKIIAKGGDGIKGLPIGNLTSQFFANVYLDVFDHYIKDDKSVKYYVRYMDDFCIFSNDKELLKELYKEVVIFLDDKLKLDVKDTATLINTSLHGLPFLGVRIFPKMIRLKKENFKRSFSKLKTREWEYGKGFIDYNRYTSSMQSLIAHMNYYGNNLLQRRLYNGAIS
jgi:retron-type reverse transcriptase